MNSDLNKRMDLDFGLEKIARSAEMSALFLFMLWEEAEGIIKWYPTHPPGWQILLKGCYYFPDSNEKLSLSDVCVLLN